MYVPVLLKTRDKEAFTLFIIVHVVTRHVVIIIGGVFSLCTCGCVSERQCTMSVAVRARTKSGFPSFSCQHTQNYCRNPWLPTAAFVPVPMTPRHGRCILRTSAKTSCNHAIREVGKHGEESQTLLHRPLCSHSGFLSLLLFLINQSPPPPCLPNKPKRRLWSSRPR